MTLAILVQGCTMDYDQLAADRIEESKKNRGDIVIVAIEEVVKTDYMKGVKLAVQQVNSRPDKLLGRTLRLLVKEGGEDFETIVSTLQQIAANPKITAVLGHRTSKVAIPASVIYEKSKIIFLPSFATSKGLTNHNFGFVFRMAPNNLVMSEQLASLAKVLNYQKIVSLYAYDDYSREFAFSFEDAALKQGIGFAFRSAFSADKDNYRPLITQFKNNEFDAIFISTGTKSAVRMIKQLRSMGLKMPILSGDGIKPLPFIEAIGEEGNNTILPTLYSTYNKTAINQDFRLSYKKQYKIDADYNAAQGYDSVMLLVAGIERAQSTMPSSLSSALRYIPYWHGVTGVHGFNDRGEILGKHYVFKVFKRGKWTFLPAADIPYMLDAFKQDIKAIRPRQDNTDFKQEFSHRLHPIDFKKINIDLAHELLQFENLGWIYDDSQAEEFSDELLSLDDLAKKKGFALIKCSIPFSRLSIEESQQHLIECYGTLAPKVQTIYLSISPNMDHAFLKQLNQSLDAYKVPVIAFQTDNKPLNMGIAMAFDRANVQLKSPKAIEAFNGILTKIKAFKLVEKLADMPIITADLNKLSNFGFLDSKELLTLSPRPSEEQVR